MYLSENKTLRMVTLCGLYVAQGIPWGFVTVTFAAWLSRPEHDLSVEQIGPILAVATLPWSLKFLWGPLMDRFTIRRIGRRRPWILFAQGMAILVLASMLLIDDLPSLVWTESPGDGALTQFFYQLVPGPLAGLILLANVFVSMQDVAVDALAVDLLKEEERGIANGLMYGSSYFGTAVGGAGLGYLVASYGIEAGLLGQASLLVLIMALPLCFRERPPGEPATDPPARQAVDFGESPILPHPDAPRTDQPAGGSESPASSRSVFADLLRAFSLRATLVGAGLALGVKIGIGVLTAVLVNYLMKEGGWTQAEYTSMVGGYAVGLGLVGSAAGGYLADKFGPKLMIIATSVMLGATWIAYGCSASLFESKSAMRVLLLGQELMLAMMAVALFSLFMGISWPRVAATQFTTYMALMNLSTTIGSYTAGALTQHMEVMQILVVSGALQIFLILPVLVIDPAQTRRVLGNE